MKSYLPQPPHERCLVVQNPTKEGTKRYLQAQRQIVHLMQTFGLKYEKVNTTPDPYTTQEKILKAMKATDLLIVLGGDGTVNVTVGGLLRADPDKRAVMLPSRVGTANDFERSHNGKMRGRGAMSRIIERGAPIDIHPLEITVIDGSSDLKRQLIAVNNVGFGHTALTARMLDEPEHRQGWLKKIPVAGSTLQELRTGWRSTQTMVAYESTEYGASQQRGLLDRSLVHAPKAAKYGRFDIDHTDPEFLYTTIERPTVFALGEAALRMVAGKSVATKETSMAFWNGNQPVLGQADGEVFEVPPFALVTAKLSEESFQTYSLRAA